MSKFPSLGLSDFVIKLTGGRMEKLRLKFYSGPGGNPLCSLFFPSHYAAGGRKRKPDGLKELGIRI